MNKGLTAIKEVTREEVMGLAQNGLRELFDLASYKVCDATTGDVQSHFVYDMSTHRCYLIDLKTSYELVTAFYSGGDKQSILQSLNGIAKSVH
ncbi:hypothetical protein [Sutcliffiella cohnii]|uniref:hypothetical protein n=1 Tax=Sutcliffiella cohnii TaxID=33932 RepID=UPI002E1ECD72|nr:hypothetical protein [Sutcliffiella cohnii]